MVRRHTLGKFLLHSSVLEYLHSDPDTKFGLCAGPDPGFGVILKAEL
jgi:hypothetical protein